MCIFAVLPFGPLSRPPHYSALKRLNALRMCGWTNEAVSSNVQSPVRLCLLEKACILLGASVLPVPYNITVNWKMQVSVLMTSLRVSNPKYIVEEEPKETSKCLRDVCGEMQWIAEQRDGGQLPSVKVG